MEDVTQWFQLLFRWLHVIAGVTWIGHLYFFNFVNAQVAKTYDADSKKKVIPELMPRALYWFRWGAAYTWITGILLLGMVYYMGGSVLVDEPAKISVGAGSAASLGTLVVAFLIYDVLWKQMAKQEMAAAAISFVLTLGVAFGLSQIYSGRALFIHVGAMFGTIMAANVWMRIWPNQRRIIAAAKEGKAPEAAWGAMAGLRSKHNTYLSVPLIFFMVSNHYPTVYGASSAVAAVGFIGAFVLVGWGLTKMLYNKSGTEAPKFF